MATVLVAEDDADIRELVAYKLHEAGHQVVGVADGLAAVAAARAEAPDVAIVDVSMPGLSGIQVCSALREHPATAGIPVILLSARAHADDSETGLRAGAVDYVTKPFSPRELVQRVESLLETR
jgi:DNA-binding response OmpR family regulator